MIIILLKNRKILETLQKILIYLNNYNILTKTPVFSVTLNFKGLGRILAGIQNIFNSSQPG